MLESIPEVTEVLLWNDSRIGVNEWEFTKTRVVTGQNPWGVFPRLALGLLAKNKHIFTQDDDWLIDADAFRQMYEGFLKAPTLVHGIFGRSPTEEDTYALEHNHEERDCEMVLTSGCFFSRTILPHTWHLIEQPAIQQCLDFNEQNGSIRSNGEDIILSYSAMRFNNRPNKCYGYRIEKLPDYNGISSNANHRKVRTNLMQRCRDFLCLL
jgi:hypothetical protein